MIALEVWLIIPFSSFLRYFIRNGITPEKLA